MYENKNCLCVEGRQLDVFYNTENIKNKKKVWRRVKLKFLGVFHQETSQHLPKSSLLSRCNTA